MPFLLVTVPGSANNDRHPYLSLGARLKRTCLPMHCAQREPGAFWPRLGRLDIRALHGRNREISHFLNRDLALSLFVAIGGGAVSSSLLTSSSVYVSTSKLCLSASKLHVE